MIEIFFFLFFTLLNGKLYLIVGPSGAGKGTIIKAIKAKMPEIIFPISCTTRPMRPNEKEGEVYNFISKEDFLNKIEKNEFLEWAHVHGRDNFYGTLKTPILNALKKDKKILREVDIQGVESISKIISKNNLCTIFITVPDWETLQNRILRRAEMSQEELEKRKLSYIKEMEFTKECDFVVHSLEGKINEAVEEVLRI